MVEQNCRLCKAVLVNAALNDFLQLVSAADKPDLKVEHRLRVGPVDKIQVLGDRLVKYYTPDGSIYDFTLPDFFTVFVFDLPCNTDLNRRVYTYVSVLVGDKGLVRAHECLSRPMLLAFHGQIICSEDHVLGRYGYRPPVLRAQQVVRRKHQEPCFGLRLGGERDVYGHLVSVKVGVVCRTHKRMELESPALDQNRLKCLDAEPVERWCAVQKHRVLGDDFVKRIPYLCTRALHHLLCALDVVRKAVLDQLLHYKRFEQLNGHLFGKAALIYLEFGADNYNAAA